MGREGARERVEFSPEAETERSGVCSDEAEAQRREDESVAGGAGDAEVRKLRSQPP